MNSSLRLRRFFLSSCVLPAYAGVSSLCGNASAQDFQTVSGTLVDGATASLNSIAPYLGLSEDYLGSTVTFQFGANTEELLYTGSTATLTDNLDIDLQITIMVTDGFGGPLVFGTTFVGDLGDLTPGDAMPTIVPGATFSNPGAFEGQSISVDFGPESLSVARTWEPHVTANFAPRATLDPEGAIPTKLSSLFQPVGAPGSTIEATVTVEYHTVTPQLIPEPGAAWLVVGGGLLTCLRRRRKR